METSDETDKSVLAKTQHSDLIAPHTIPKSFIHPPTVNRKPLGLISAVKYKEECEEMEQESKRKIYSNYEKCFNCCFVSYDLTSLSFKSSEAL